ncbi:MAG: PPC domain-containing protein, partial [Acidobacteria bacterium]|nr:PPC domain-containing protein [Acidobacteriota bacterium]
MSQSSSPPDLVVSAASVDDDTLDAGQTTFLNYAIRNQGNGAAAGSPRVTAFRSADSTIWWGDTSVSAATHVAVDSLGPRDTVAGRIRMPAAPSAGTWYYGACVQNAASESDTANNCSAGVRVIVSGGSAGGCARNDLGTLSGTVTVSGTLDNDCVSPNFSGALAQYYSFTLERPAAVEIDLISSEFDAWLALREGADAAGRALVQDDDGGQGTNSRIETALSAGTYTIEATSFAAGETGAFTLTVTAAGDGGGGCALDDLGALGGTVMRVGNLGGDCESPNYPGRLARYYSFTLGQAGPVEIDLFSTAFDAFLTLREGTDVEGRLVATDDDGGQGTNSRIARELPAGTYTIEATSYATGVTGAFTLTAMAAGGGGGGCALDDLGALSGTATRVGNLGNDCESPNYSGKLARYYSFTLGQAGPVEIDLVSSVFDAFLTLREGTDVAGPLVVSDDDGGLGTNSRISTALSAGTYTIEATSYAPGVTGAFTLTVTAAGGGGGGCALDDLGALSGAVTRAGNLGGDCESPSYSGRLARYYSFTLGQAGPVEIDMVSSAFDTWLTLREGAGVAGRLVVSDDDGGQGTNSRIGTPLSAGTYTIEATSYAPG